MIGSARIHFAAGLLLGTAVLFIGQSGSAAETAGTSVERMKKDLFFLAGEECEGRGVETEGINKAADHIAGVFKELGLKPSMPDGSYFQPFTVSGSSKLSAPNSFVLKGPLNQEITPPIGKQYNVCGLTGKGKVTDDVVFAGYGITVKNGYDDYKDIDVKGKIVIIIRQTPRANSKETPFPNAISHAPLNVKIANAEAHKAAGVLFVNDRQMAGTDDPLMTFEYAQGGGSAPFPVFHVRRALVDQMLAGSNTTLTELEADIDGDLKPRSRTTGWNATLEASVVRTENKVKNVIGVLEGKGPLANETVVIGAHYDHLGRGERGSRSKGSTAIHYGADDNGSGTTTVLELARRLAAMKDREGRRIVLMLFSGEERGLLGSAFYCKNPIFPLKDTVAMINLDMVGRLRDDAKVKKPNLEIGGVGSAKNFESLVDELNKKYDFNIKKSRSGTGPSDHTSFYLKSVPVFFFFTGMHPEYHLPTDKPDLINYEGMSKIADMVEELALKIAGDKQRPEYVAVKAGKNDSPARSPGGIPTIKFMPGDYADEQSNGVLVGGVAPGGPAEKGGLKEGDWIIEIAGQPVRNMASYMKTMGGQKGGEPLEFLVKRGDKKLPLKITPIPPAMKD
jgi:hypothetical protein